MVGLLKAMRVGPIGPSPSADRVSPRSVPRALRPAPAQKTPPAPQSTATRSESSASNSRKASVSARAAGPSTALRASGRSITIVATVSLRSIRMAMVRSPAAGPRPGSAAPSNLRLSALRGQPGRKAGLQWAGRHARGGADSVAVRRRLGGVRGLRSRALAALAGCRGTRAGARPGLRHRSEPAAPVAGVGRDRPRPVLVVAAAGPAPCARGAPGRGERRGPPVPRRVLRHGAERPRLLLRAGCPAGPARGPARARAARPAPDAGARALDRAVEGPPPRLAAAGLDARERRMPSQPPPPARGRGERLRHRARRASLPRQPAPLRGGPARAESLGETRSWSVKRSSTRPGRSRGPWRPRTTPTWRKR